MNRQIATMHKTMPEMPSFGLMLHGIMAKVRNAVRIDIPAGYQDETGFHLGVKRAQKGV
jgi:hypothetical protein